MTNPIPDCNPDSPEWAFRAVAMINERDKRIAALEQALREIRDFSAYSHPDEEIIAMRDAAVKESEDCPACQRAKKSQWPPSGLCEKHYDTVMRAQDRVTQMFNYKQTWEPCNIARRVLEEK